MCHVIFISYLRNYFNLSEDVQPPQNIPPVISALYLVIPSICFRIAGATRFENREKCCKIEDGIR
jgi:hypothetical protein